MQVELQPQLQPFDNTGLRTFLRDQQARLNNLNKIIGTANERIAALRKAAAPPPKGVSPAERQVYKTVAERQLISQIGEIRREVDKELIPLVKAMQGAADEAKVRGERHHDLFSILRNAKTGPAVEAAQLRAAYATILESTGPVELAKWAQQAIDTGDAVLGTQLSGRMALGSRMSGRSLRPRS